MVNSKKRFLTILATALVSILVTTGIVIAVIVNLIPRRDMCGFALHLENCVALNVKDSYVEREQVNFKIKANDGYTLPDKDEVEITNISLPYTYELNIANTEADVSFTIYKSAAMTVKSIISPTPTPTPRPGVYHTARFLSYSGSVLQTVQVEEGKNPIYTGPIPTRDPEVDISYVFANWTPYELPTYLPKPIFEDTDFRPEFKTEIRKYNCKMTGENCKINSSYSQTVAFPYNSEGHFYVNVDETTTYKLPDTVEIKRNGQILTPGIDYEYNKASTSAHIILKILGETEIKAVAIPK